MADDATGGATPAHALSLKRRVPLPSSSRTKASGSRRAGERRTEVLVVDDASELFSVSFAATPTDQKHMVVEHYVAHTYVETLAPLALQHLVVGQSHCGVALVHISGALRTLAFALGNKMISTAPIPRMCVDAYMPTRTEWKQVTIDVDSKAKLELTIRKYTASEHGWFTVSGSFDHLCVMGSSDYGEGVTVHCFRVDFRASQGVVEFVPLFSQDVLRFVEGATNMTSQTVTAVCLPSLVAVWEASCSKLVTFDLDTSSFASDVIDLSYLQSLWVSGAGSVPAVAPANHHCVMHKVAGSTIGLQLTSAADGLLCLVDMTTHDSRVLQIQSPVAPPVRHKGQTGLAGVRGHSLAVVPSMLSPLQVSHSSLVLYTPGGGVVSASELNPVVNELFYAAANSMGGGCTTSSPSKGPVQSCPGSSDTVKTQQRKKQRPVVLDTLWSSMLEGSGSGAYGIVAAAGTGCSYLVTVDDDDQLGFYTIS